MTPDERAEKILPGELYRKIRLEVATQIREAVKKARSICDHESPCCDNCIDKFTQQGRASMREEAAKVAEKYQLNHKHTYENSLLICEGTWQTGDKCLFERIRGD